MSSALGTVRENIQAQGFWGVDDQTGAQISVLPFFGKVVGE
jgi:hypothetical protein